MGDLTNDNSRTIRLLKAKRCASVCSDEIARHLVRSDRTENQLGRKSRTQKMSFRIIIY